MSDMKYYEERLNKASELFNDGFSSQAGKKKANNFLSSAFDFVVSNLQKDLIDQERSSESEDKKRRINDLYWSVPSLHNWKDKHNKLFSDYPEHVSSIGKLIELRAAIKEAEVVKIEKNSVDVRVEEIRSFITDEMEKKKQQFVEGLELAKIFDNLAVSVNAHLVTNDKGTEFTRHFFYLNGKLTALNMIMAIADAKAQHDKLNGGNLADWNAASKALSSKGFAKDSLEKMRGTVVDMMEKSVSVNTNSKGECLFTKPEQVANSLLTSKGQRKIIEEYPEMLDVVQNFSKKMRDYQLNDPSCK